MRRLSLGTQMFVLLMVIVLMAVGGTAAVWVQHTRGQLDLRNQQRALAIAQSVAGMPAVREAFTTAHPQDLLQPIALGVQRETGADYVVIANRDQIRYAHPNPAQIGQRLSTDGSAVLAGQTWTGTETGTLGRSVRGKAPIMNSSGQVIGLVSVGVLEEAVAAQFGSALPPLVWTVLAVLLAGAVAAALLARRLRRQTFGLEPHEIAAMFEQREAVLHGVKEGVLAFDLEGRITVVNDVARRLLGVPESIGTVADIPVSDRLRDVLAGEDDGEDRIVLHNDRVLVLNRMPVSAGERDLGWVVTLRDRTELVRLMQDLDQASSTTDALRAQAHEFANRMHTVVGLLSLEEFDEAIRYITETAEAHHRLAGSFRDRVGEPTLAALLLAKSAEAAERGVSLTVSPESKVDPEAIGDPHDAVLIVGNLVDNALDALDGEPGGIEVALTTDDVGLRIQVRDSGPGIAPELAEEVFRRGFTTKAAYAGSRGLGLALTRQACLRRGGWVRTHNETGAVFTALLPALARRP